MAREGRHASAGWQRGKCSRVSELLERRLPYRISIIFNGAELAMASCDVYDVCVVRKQLYISDEHERALKAKARELGVSEAALVRRLLDGLLLDGPVGGGLAGTGAAEALEGFLEGAHRLAESHKFPEGYQFSRDELYEDRL